MQLPPGLRLESSLREGRAESKSEKRIQFQRESREVRGNSEATTTTASLEIKLDPRYQTESRAICETRILRASGRRKGFRKVDSLRVHRLFALKRTYDLSSTYIYDILISRRKRSEKIDYSPNFSLFHYLPSKSSKGGTSRSFLHSKTSLSTI